MHVSVVLAALTLKRLQGLGFARTDCERALDATDGSYADSAVWLTEHASVQSHGASPGYSQQMSRFVSCCHGNA